MDTIIEVVAFIVVGVVLSKTIKEMEKQKFFFIAELASIIIAIFKTVFALTKAIIKLCDDLIK